MEWKNYEATVVSRTTITLRNVSNEAREKLELRDRIIKVKEQGYKLKIFCKSKSKIS